MRVLKFWGPFAPIAMFFATALSFLSLFRIGLVLWQWPRVAATDGLAQIALYGVRVDCMLLCFLLIAPVLATPVLMGRKWWPALLASVLTCFALVLVFMEFATPSFVNQFDARPNRLFIEYLEHPKEVAGTLWAAYKLPLAIAIAAMGACGWACWRYFRHFEIGAPWSRRKSLRVMALLLCLMGLGARSSLRHRPANPALFAFSGDGLVNHLALNSTYTAMYAVYRLKDEARSAEIYGTLPRDEIVARVRAASFIPPADFVESAAPTMHRQRATQRRARPLNLVIILEESMGAAYVERLGGLPLTPHLEALSKDGWWLERLYATGTRSVRGIEAVVAGFLPTPSRSVVKLGKAQSGFFTLASVLGQQGFFCEFLYGGESHFDDMASFFTGNGFQSIIDERDFEHPTFVGSWGVSDEDLFDRAHERFVALDGTRPFFALVFTSSNHSPFQFPDGRIQLHEKPKASRYNAVKYADFALGAFFKKAKHASYYDHTVFLIVADHEDRIVGPEMVPIEKYHIPGLILAPRLPPRADDRIVSQIDLPPTLLSLIGIDSTHPMIGHDLTRPFPEGQKGRAIMQFGVRQAHLDGDDVVVLRPEKAPSFFHWDDTAKKLHPSALFDTERYHAALAHALLPSWLYRERLYFNAPPE